MTKKLGHMMCLDLYLSSLNEKEHNHIGTELNCQNTQPLPLLSWDIYSSHYFSKLLELKRGDDILKVKTFAKKFNWKSDVTDLFKDEEFEAIILTDLSQKIIWVNEGFTEMTGYSKGEAMHQTPRFLQGPESALDSKVRIRKKLTGIEPFTEVIINYKKNQEPYECEVKIFPLFNERTTHFMALEKRVV